MVTYGYLLPFHNKHGSIVYRFWDNYGRLLVWNANSNSPPHSSISRSEVWYPQKLEGWIQCDFDNLATRFSVLTHYRSVSYRQTEGQTFRRRLRLHPAMRRAVKMKPEVLRHIHGAFLHRICKSFSCSQNTHVLIVVKDGRDIYNKKPSVDEIGERYRLNHAIVVKLYHPYTRFHRNVGLPHRWIATFSAHRDVFLFLRLINNLNYLLTDPCLVDNNLWQFSWITCKRGGEKKLLQGLECYTHTQMKAYDKYVE